MNVLFFIPERGEATKGIREVVEGIAQRAKTEVFLDINELFRRLRQPAESPAIAVLFVRDQKDFDHIASIRYLYPEIPLILILPEGGSNMTEAGYNLSPRFLTYADRDFGELAAVLGKILKHQERKQATEKRCYEFR